MLSFAAVATGADKAALTRAFSGGVATAGDILARMDLDEAGGELAALKTKMDEQSATIARLEREIQALRGEGASAAARRDSEAILQAVRDLAAML
jgi:multidrug resistance efflux pump